MLSDKTVFVLGAGASAPYGYPTGEKLRTDILKLSGNRSFKELLHSCGFMEEDITSFREAFLRSGTSSIDAFLEYRSEFIEIGKTIIAIILMDCENDNLLHGGDWYRYLFQVLNSKFEEFRENNLSIITFNYDRSLEHFLFTALQNLYGKSNDECSDALKSIPIIHVHGKIGKLTWEGGTRSYEARSVSKLLNDPSSNLWIREAADGIKIIHEEDIKASEEFEEARNKLQDAQRIYFLGFGYHPINTKRLRIDLINKKYLKQATGTTYKLTDNERVKIQEGLLFGKFSLSLLNARGLKIHDYLREHVVLK